MQQPPQSQQQSVNNIPNRPQRKLPPDALEHKSIEREIKHSNNHSYGSNFQNGNGNQHNSNSKSKREPPPINNYNHNNDHGNMNNNNNMNGNDVRNHNNNVQNNNINGNNMNNNNLNNNMNGNSHNQHQHQHQHQSSSSDMNNNNMNQNERQKPQNPPHLQSQQPFDNEQKQAQQEQAPSGKERDAETARKHNEWLNLMAKDFILFKTKKCEQGMNCPKGINCCKWHGSHDRRRVINPSCLYKPEPCPQLFDFYGTKEFNFKRQCQKGDDCTFAHNRIEIGYHPLCYKTIMCPYKVISGYHPYNNVECPFKRTPDWFQQHFGAEMIKKTKRNTVRLTNGLHLALDYCPFAHDIFEQRYKEDPPIVYNEEKKNRAPHRNDPPPHHSQNVLSQPINPIPSSSNHSVSNSHHGPIPPHEMSANPHPSPNPPPSHQSQHSHHSYQKRPASNPPTAPPSHHSLHSNQSHHSHHSPQRAPSFASNNHNNPINSHQNNSNPHNSWNNNNNNNNGTVTKQGMSETDKQQLASENAEWAEQNKKDDDDW
mmetsp:Transcript_50949/g.45741  ORF Transcript_50949/g.45741 Transcript_50949/m.45741 type:complete len:540 (-) Transcript_50949:72-1691(-)